MPQHYKVHKLHLNFKKYYIVLENIPAFEIDKKLKHEKVGFSKIHK